MAIPIRDSQIAPPTTTGEVLDTQSVPLARSGVQAERELGRAQARGIESIGELAQGVGSIFERIESTNQRARMLEALDTLDREIYEHEDALSKNRALLDEWSTDDPEGGAAEWQRSRTSALGEGLRGQWRDEFEHQARIRFLSNNANVDKMALEQAHSSTRASDASMINSHLSNPNLDDISGSIRTSSAMVQERIETGINMGIYSPTEGAQIMAQYQSQIVSAHYLAVSADIQDGNGWRDFTVADEDGNPKFYNGYNGALEMVEDKIAQGELSQQQGDHIINQIDEQYTLKGTRGNSVQQQLSVEYINEMGAAIQRGQRFTADEIWNDPRINFEETRSLRRNGDRSAANYIQNMQDEAIDEITSDEDFTIAPEVWRRLYDQTWSDQNFQDWLISNGNKYHSQEQIAKILRMPREVYTSAKASEVRRMVEEQTQLLLQNANTSEERSALLAQQEEDIRSILGSFTDADVANEMDLTQVRANYLRGHLNEEVFRDYAREDRRLNPAESMAYIAQQGGYRGLTGIPRFRQEVTQVGELHRTMIADMYGEDNILDIRWGDAGTFNEGRVVFRVRDTLDTDVNGQPRDKWIRVGVTKTADDRGEEFFEEFDPSTYNPELGEEWNQAAAPILRAQNAAQVAADEIASSELRAKAEYGATYEELVNQYSEEFVSQAMGERVSEVPGAPGFTPHLDQTIEWYKDNSRGVNIPSGALGTYVNNSLMDDGEKAAFWEHVYNTAKNEMFQEIENQENSGGINLFRNNGTLRWGAKGAVSRIASDYGLPDSYAERILNELYGWSDE